eukprot:8693552-Alexandrium_andersonii.AAC.1
MAQQVRRGDLVAEHQREKQRWHRGLLDRRRRPRPPDHLCRHREARVRPSSASRLSPVPRSRLPPHRVAWQPW